MLTSTFDPTKPLRYVRYGRMSNQSQNARSPDQQFAEIDSTLNRRGYDWVHVGDYRDDGVSGRYLKRRPGFQRMLTDIKSGTLKVDAILLHTWERIGRAEEIAEIRRQLWNQHGVLIMTADSGFADPTSVSGKALGFVDNLRATEENRAKAEAVLRGKRDVVRHGHWAGAKPPFGMRLETQLLNRNGRVEVDYSRLVPDPETSWILQAIFEKAHETGWGCQRLASAFNANGEIPEKFKPFLASTINRWLGNPIYKGTLVWERVATDIIDDVRVVRRNPESAQLVIPNFCEPLVESAIWDGINATRRRRGEIVKRARQLADEGDGKVLQPLAPGLALKYPLSGLVLCGTCGRTMTISSGPAYKNKAGEIKRYQSYFCSRRLDNACNNAARVAEEWLWNEVLHRLNDFLLPDRPPTPLTIEAVQSMEWFRSMHQQVESELHRLSNKREHRGPALEHELTELRREIAGLRQSLGNPDLPEIVRRDVESRYSEALARIGEVEKLLSQESEVQIDADQLLDPQETVDRLNRLSEVLLSGNISEINVELAHHIDSIRCFADGRIVLKICRLGVLPRAADAFRGRNCKPEPDGIPPVSPTRSCAGQDVLRRRTIRRVEDRESAHFAADPLRYAELPESWFEVQEFRRVRRSTWPEAFADEVYAARFSTDGHVQMTFEQLEKRFGRTKPTLRAAVAIAEQRRR